MDFGEFIQPQGRSRLWHKCKFIAKIWNIIIDVDFGEFVNSGKSRLWYKRKMYCKIPKCYYWFGLCWIYSTARKVEIVVQTQIYCKILKCYYWYGLLRINKESPDCGTNANLLQKSNIFLFVWKFAEFIQPAQIVVQTKIYPKSLRYYLRTYLLKLRRFSIWYCIELTVQVNIHIPADVSYVITHPWSIIWI